MKRFNQSYTLGLVLLLLLGGTQSVFAKNNKLKKQGQLVESIEDAVTRSESEQGRIKVRFSSEADQRIESWHSREQEMIEIKHTGTSSIAPVDLGEADYTYEEVGVDESGLNNLHSDYIEEPINIDFDKELREVSSIKD